MNERVHCLSARFGGTITHIEEGGTKKINTFCRFYQKPPHKRGILCLGIQDYPPCPDLSICVIKHRVEIKEVDLEEEEVKGEAEGLPL